MTGITPRLLQPKSTYTIDYPFAIELADKQNSVFWTHSEIELSKDIQDILVSATPAERHGIIYVLKIFTKYELEVGTEYWGNRVMNTFNRPDIQRMASCFSFFELNVHAPFYDKINKLLHLDTDEFYNSYTEDDVLSERVKFLEEALDDDDILYSLGVFSMIEGAILYANFAFLKHFQANGKNKMKNLVSGIDFSVRDEELHHQGGAMLFLQLLSETQMSTEELEALYERLYKAADILREHEHRIADNIFEMGTMGGITCHQLKNFIDSRLDLCLTDISLHAKYKPASNPIAEWFYTGVASKAIIHDFFASLGNQYHRNWIEDDFEWHDDQE
jgi:ribonucleotide reductase beta subunit family protein with ferritin-like domain